MPYRIGRCDYCLSPSYQSFGGKLLESINEKPHPEFSTLTCAQKISIIGQRVLLLIAYLAASTLDLVVSIAMTVSIIPAIRMGRAHFVNLICSIASLIFGFGILSGNIQQVNYLRKQYGKPLAVFSPTIRTVEELLREIQLLETKGSTDFSFNYLLPILYVNEFRNITREQFDKISELIERLSKAGADINAPLKKNAHDHSRCNLIHYLSNFLYQFRQDTVHEFYDNTPQYGLTLLITTAIKCGADPYQQTKAISDEVVGTDLINTIFLSDVNRFSFNRKMRNQIVRAMVNKGIKFDQPFVTRHAGHNSILLHALNFFTDLEVIALLIEGKAKLQNQEQQRVLENLYSGHMQESENLPPPFMDFFEQARKKRLVCIKLVKALEVDAPLTEKRWAAATFLRYNCLENAMKLLNQSDIIPTREEDRINWSSELLIAAIDSGNVDNINSILGRFVLTWNDAAEERITKLVKSQNPANSKDQAADFEMLNAINRYKAKVRDILSGMAQFDQLEAPVNNIVTTLLF